MVTSLKDASTAILEKSSNPLNLKALSLNSDNSRYEIKEIYSGLT
jgi:hypothetical protein